MINISSNQLLVGSHLIIYDDVWFYLNHEIVVPIEEIKDKIHIAEIIIKGFKQRCIDSVVIYDPETKWPIEKWSRNSISKAGEET